MVVILLFLLRARIGWQKNGSGTNSGGIVIHNYLNPLEEAGNHMNTSGALQWGPKMTLAQFGERFDLSAWILCALDELGVSGPHAFAHMDTKTVLTENVLKPGEIANVLEAVDLWKKMGAN